MGFLDALLGRTKVPPPNLDNLFALPSATVTLQVATDFKPTGTGSTALPSRTARSVFYCCSVIGPCPRDPQRVILSAASAVRRISQGSLLR